jgi:hypothetical protein
MSVTPNMTDQEQLTKLDILLRRKQVFLETPRAILLIVATTAAVAGLLGYKLGRQAPQPIIVQFQQPLAVKLTPP